MSASEYPAAWLRSRAKSYARDAELLRSNGDTDDAVVFEAIRDELRKCADAVEAAHQMELGASSWPCHGPPNDLLSGAVKAFRPVEAYRCPDGHMTISSGYAIPVPSCYCGRRMKVSDGSAS